MEAGAFLTVHSLEEDILGVRSHFGAWLEWVQDLTLGDADTQLAWN